MVVGGHAKYPTGLKSKKRTKKRGTKQKMERWTKHIKGHCMTNRQLRIEWNGALVKRLSCCSGVQWTRHQKASFGHKWNPDLKYTDYTHYATWSGETFESTSKTKNTYKQWSILFGLFTPLLSAVTGYFISISFPLFCKVVNKPWRQDTT